MAHSISSHPAFAQNYGHNRKKPGVLEDKHAGQACKKESESMHTTIIQFIESLQARHLSENSSRTYRSELMRLADFLDKEGILLGGVTQHHLTRYIARHGNANSTANRQLVILRQFFRWNQHPCGDFLAQMKGPRVTRQVPEFLNNSEEKLLRKTLKDRTDQRHQQRDRALICLILNTGVRVSEAVGLDVTDVDLESKRIKLLAKGGKNRNKFLSADVRTQLGSLFASYSEIEMQGPVFLSSRKLRLSDRQVRRIVSRWCQLAGIDKDVHPHTLRHTFATSLLAKNGNLRLVQKALDHENPQTTAIYTHVVDDELQAAIESRLR